MNILSGKMCFVFVFLHLICKLMWIDTLASASLQRNWSKKMQPLWIPPGKAAPIFNSFEINVCLFLRICTVFKPPIQFIHNNYFWLKLNCLISLWYSAVPNTISPLRQKYLEHDVWITPRNIIYLAFYGIFLTAIFLIPFIYLVKELFAFSYILSQQ